MSKSWRSCEKVDIEEAGEFSHIQTGWSVERLQRGRRLKLMLILFPVQAEEISRMPICFPSELWHNSLDKILFCSMAANEGHKDIHFIAYHPNAYVFHVARNSLRVFLVQLYLDWMRLCCFRFEMARHTEHVFLFLTFVRIPWQKTFVITVTATAALIVIFNPSTNRLVSNVPQHTHIVRNNYWCFQDTKWTIYSECLWCRKSVFTKLYEVWQFLVSWISPWIPLQPF